MEDLPLRIESHSYNVDLLKIKLIVDIKWQINEIKSKSSKDYTVYTDQLLNKSSKESLQELSSVLQKELNNVNLSQTLKSFSKFAIITIEKYCDGKWALPGIGLKLNLNGWSPGACATIDEYSDTYDSITEYINDNKYLSNGYKLMF